MLTEPPTGQQIQVSNLNQRDIVCTAIFILILTIGACSLFFIAYSSLETYTPHVFVHWGNESNIELKTTPYWFMYDSSNLYTLKAITGEDKMTLLGLVETDSTAHSYYKAIEKLSFLSNQK